MDVSQSARLLLGSGGIRTPERKAAWLDWYDTFLGAVDDVLFIPYALADHDGYVDLLLEKGFSPNRGLKGLHREADPRAAIESASSIYVGGGNSFRLLHSLQEQGLLEPIRERALAGCPYIGISAGSNLACPTICTTNDMPIIYPAGFEALGLIPWQINPHFFSGSFRVEQDGEWIDHGGETRERRLSEYHELNETPVIGLREGSALRVEGGAAELLGVEGACLFRRGKDVRELTAGPLPPL